MPRLDPFQAFMLGWHKRAGAEGPMLEPLPPPETQPTQIQDDSTLLIPYVDSDDDVTTEDDVEITLMVAPRTVHGRHPLPRPTPIVLPSDYQYTPDLVGSAQCTQQAQVKPPHTHAIVTPEHIRVAKRDMCTAIRRATRAKRGEIQDGFRMRREDLSITYNEMMDGVGHGVYTPEEVHAWYVKEHDKILEWYQYELSLLED